MQHKDFHPATGWASLHFVKMSLQMPELQGEKGGVEFIDENGGGPGVRAPREIGPRQSDRVAGDVAR